jgi:ABC-type proline/glycine betaine transport system permease subunit
MTPIPNFIDTTYGYLYIPPVVYAFLSLTIESATLDAVVFTLPKWIYILFLLISLIGSSIVHRILVPQGSFCGARVCQDSHGWSGEESREASQ